jgi:hypothetical protein
MEFDKVFYDMKVLRSKNSYDIPAETIKEGAFPLLKTLF